jgi:AcrR family transcriptional regulator
MRNKKKSSLKTISTNINSPIPSIKGRDKAEKIQRIKRVTLELLEKFGYFETTNTKIAEVAKISVGLLYKYFPKGKLDVIHSIYLDDKLNLAEYEQKLQLISNSITPSSFYDFLLNLTLNFIQRHQEQKNILRIYEIAMLSEPTIFKDIRGWAQQALTIVPIIRILEQKEIITHHFSDDEIIMHTNVIDVIVHRYIFFEDAPFSTLKQFVDYILNLFLYLFGIKIRM